MQPIIGKGRCGRRFRVFSGLSWPVPGWFVRLLRRSLGVQGAIAGVLFFGVAAACVWTCYVAGWVAFRHTIDEELLCFARLAAERIDPETHARLTRPEQQNGPEYLTIVEPLRRMVQASQLIRYIYTLRPTPRGLCFVLDTGQPSDTDGDGVIDQAGLGELYQHDDPYLGHSVRTARSYVVPRPVVDRWGVFYSAYVPVIHPGGRLECVVGVDIEASKYLSRLGALRWALMLSWGMSALASLFFGMCVAFFQRARRAHLVQLSESEQRYALAINGSNEGLWDWDIRTGSVYLSVRFKQLLGYGDDELLPESGVVPWFFVELHPDDRARVHAAQSAHFTKDVPYDIEFRLRTRSGVYRWFHVRGQVVRDASGEPFRMVGSLSDVTERVRLRHQMRRAARCDRLTRLPNRSVLLERLRRAIRRHKRGEEGLFAVLFLDLDRFKIVNDSLGHEAGDALLVAIAERLRRHLRSSDSLLTPDSKRTAARHGGDEFVVLLEGLPQPEDVAAVASRLLDTLADPYQIGAYRVASTVSIGIVVGDPTYDRAEDVLRDADTAMYVAKSTCAGGYAIFDATMRQRAYRRMQLEQGLRASIDQNQLFLEYQPIVCLRTGVVVSVEVLVRWNHPELGRITPDEFIPVAEECGLIVPLGEWVITNALRQLVCWRAGKAADRIPGVNINLARQHLLVPGLVRWVRDEAERNGIDPADVYLEITEGAVMRDVSAAGVVLDALRASGFRLAIDDFGTGHSSLACLHQFPFDLLKFDRSFLEDAVPAGSRAAIVQAIATLARALNFRVVAEGIETADQLALVRNLGCDYGQGFYFDRPARLDALIPGDRPDHPAPATGEGVCGDWPEDDPAAFSGLLEIPAFRTASER